jgi:NTE family protein
MDALGYLDTVNHISNHELHNPEKFNVDQFFGDVRTNFEAIYKAVLLGSGKNPAKDSLLLEINSLHFQLKLQGKPAEVINRQVYQLIKDQVEKGLDSSEAFALSRAVEYSNKTLSSENLLKETYEEGFKRAGLFAVSNITGQRIMSTSSLHKALADKSVNMFELYDKRESSNKQNRTEQVFTALSELTIFTEDYDAHKGESNAPVMR